MKISAKTTLTLVALLGLFGLSFLMASTSLAQSSPYSDTVTICGWVKNHQNQITLTDDTTEWFVKGEIQMPQGVEHLPLFPVGVSCGCVKGVLIPRGSAVDAVVSGRQIPLARCETDKNLPKKSSLFPE